MGVLSLYIIVKLPLSLI